MMTNLQTQVVWLFVLAMPIACISWTWTHEEIFREVHAFLMRASVEAPNFILRKLSYALTCEFCFSHYVAIAFLVLTDFRLLRPDWTGLVIAGFSLVWIANIYMPILALLRADLKKEKAIADREKGAPEAPAAAKVHLSNSKFTVAMCGSSSMTAGTCCFYSHLNTLSTVWPSRTNPSR